MKAVKIIAVILVLGLLAWAGWYFYFSETAKKKKLVALIMEKGKSIPAFDADPAVLMKKTLAELQTLADSLPK